MAQALRKQDDGEDFAGKPGLRQKFHAWWHGYDLPRAEQPADADDDAENRQTAEADGSWTSARMMLAQQVWGAKFLSPGGEDYFYTLLENWPLMASHRVLDIGDTLSGTSRIINDRFGSAVDLCVSDENLIDISRAEIDSDELSEKIYVAEETIDAFAPDEETYSGILIHDTIYRLDDAGAFLDMIIQSFQAGDAILTISDFVAGEKGSSDDFDRWRELAGVSGPLQTADDIQTRLQAGGFTISKCEDESNDFGAIIRNSWARYLQGLQADRLSQMQIAVLEREAELWTCCANALKAGALRHVWIEAARDS